MMDKEHLYGWVFTFNSYDGNWIATNRDNFHKIWNKKDESILVSSKIDTLIELIIKNEGDLRKILKFKESL